MIFSRSKKALKAKQVGSIKSSFGNLTADQLKEELERQLTESVSILSKPVDFKPVDMDPDTGGYCAPVFDGLKHVGYRLRLNYRLIDDATDRASLDKAFVMVARSMGHELDHLKDFDNITTVGAINLIADMGNTYNYTELENYNRNIREVPAELGGIKYVQGYLSMRFPLTPFEDILLDCVNDLASKPRYPVHTPGFKVWQEENPHATAPSLAEQRKIYKSRFVSLQEVFDEFDVAKRDMWSHVRRYQSTPPPNCDDAFLTLTRPEFQENKTDSWGFVIEKLECARDAREANMVLATVALRQDPNLIRYALGADVPSFDFVEMFGRDTPVTIQERYAEINKISVELPKTMGEVWAQEEKEKERRQAVSGIVLKEQFVPPKTDENGRPLGDMERMKILLAYQRAQKEAEQKAKEKGGLDGPP